MAANAKVPHGTREWIEMLGAELCAGAARANLPSDYNVSMVEHFTDGATLDDGLVEGFRFDVKGGVPEFRVGVKPQERGDITILMTWAASRQLASVYGADPEHHRLFESFLSDGAMEIEGDFSALASWLGPVHDKVVDQTA